MGAANIAGKPKLYGALGIVVRVYSDTQSRSSILGICSHYRTTWCATRMPMRWNACKILSLYGILWCVAPHFWGSIRERYICLWCGCWWRYFFCYLHNIREFYWCNCNVRAIVIGTSLWVLFMNKNHNKMCLIVAKCVFIVWLNAVFDLHQ